MLFHRYKASFSSGGYKPYKYNYLRYWFLFGLLVLVPIARSFDLFYEAISFLFIEMLIIYLATENRIFRVIIPWMLLIVTVFFAGVAIYTEGARQITVAVWHFIAFIIATFTVGFNQRLQSKAEKTRLN